MLIYVSDLFLKSCVCSRNILIMDVILLSGINFNIFFQFIKYYLAEKILYFAIIGILFNEFRVNGYFKLMKFLSLKKNINLSSITGEFTRNTIFIGKLVPLFIVLILSKQQNLQIFTVLNADFKDIVQTSYAIFV